ncbi:MAG TPA: Maf family protein [Pyrinomonadaceae bacterium]|jgi:septum formation protein|nr:Maf family protein [Pyrinomonadaceae bacterium]
MPKGKLFRERLLLASQSPRRAEILRSVGWPFETFAVEIDESLRAGESPISYVERLALEKAVAAARLKDAPLVLGADTTVVVDGEIMGKPESQEDARRMLRRLRDRWHEVLTGVALVTRTGEAVTEDRMRQTVAHERTRVRFGPMTEHEIKWYVQTGEPADKAGAYAVQGYAALFIEEIEGDYWNVVGLPVQLVYKLANSL